MTATDSSARDRLRVELLLHLPDVGVNVPAGVDLASWRLLGEVKPGHAAVIDRDHDYAPEQLVSWLLDRVDALVQTEAVALASAEIAGLEESQAATIELASAGATFAALTEWAGYLTKFPAILRRGLSIKDAHDLAATVDLERSRVVEMLTALLDRFPALADLLGDEIGARARGLVSTSGAPLN